MPSLKSLGVPAQFLNAKLSSVVPLSRMRQLEQRLLGKWFRHERLCLGPDQPWLGRQWELRIASVRDSIYKVGLETISGDYEESVEFASRVHELISATFGQAEGKGEGVWIWDADDGNVVLQVAHVMEERRVMVFLTSRNAQQFQRK